MAEKVNSDLEPCGFEQSNVNYGPPKGYHEDQIRTIQAYQDDEAIVTRWRVNEEALKNIIKNGEIWLLILGSRMPPVALSTETPFPTPGDDDE